MTTYYIDTDQVSNGVGTEADPFNTLSSITSNNTYLFKRNTEFFLAGITATSQDNIVVGAYGPGQQPLWWGGDVYSSGWGTVDGNGNYESTGTFTSSPLFVYADGKRLVHGTSEAALTTGQWFYESVANTVIVADDPTGVEFRIATEDDALYFDDCDNIVVKDLAFKCFPLQNSRATVTFVGGSDHTVHNCLFEGMRGGVDFRAPTSGNCTGNKVHSCIFRNVFAPIDGNQAGNTGYVDGYEIEGCWAEGLTLEDGTSTGYHEGDEIVAADSLTIDNECFAGTGNNTGYRFVGNVIKGFDKAVTIVDDSTTSAVATTLEVERNVVYFNARGGISYVVTGTGAFTATVTYKDNIVFHQTSTSSNVSGDGNALSASGTATQTINGTLHNNLVYYGNGINWGGDVVDIQKNIVLLPTWHNDPAAGGSTYHINAANARVADSAMTIDGNIYFGSQAADPTVRWRGVDGLTTSFTTWQTTHGFDTNGYHYNSSDFDSARKTITSLTDGYEPAETPLFPIGQLVPTHTIVNAKGEFCGPRFALETEWRRLQKRKRNR